MRTLRLFRRSIVGASCLAVAIPLAASASTVTTTTVPAVAAAHRHSLLVLKDLPSAWTSEASSSDNSEFPGLKQLASCIGVASSTLNSNSPEVDSPDFSSKDASLGVSESINVFPSAKAASADIGALLRSKTPTCMQSYFNSTSGHAAIEKDTGTKIGKVSIARSTITMPSGVGTLDMRFSVMVQGTTAQTQTVLVTAVKGNVEMTLTFFAINSSFSAKLANQLTSLAINRL